MATITSANSVLMLAVAGVFPVAQKIEGFATDDAFDVESVQSVQAVMGVDGKMSAGYVPTMRVMPVSLQADSPSVDFFDVWQMAMDTTREIFIGSGTIYLPGVNRKYVMTKGVLTGYKPMAGAKKVLESQGFQLTWESIMPTPV